MTPTGFPVGQKGDRLPPRWGIWRARLRFWLLTGGLDAARWLEHESTRTLEARVGAWVFTGLYLLSFIQSGPWHLPGLPLNEAFHHARGLFFWHRTGFQLLILACHLGLGVLLGILVRNAWALAGDFSSRLDRHRFSRGQRIGTTVFLVLFMHGAVLAGSLARHPALYEHGFAHVGLARAVLGFFPLWLTDIYQLLAGLLAAAALLQFLRRFVTWQAGFSRTARLAVIVTLGGLLAAGAGLWIVARAQGPVNRGPNVLLLAVDSLRSDTLKEQMPRAHALAGQGIFFSQCVTSVAAAPPAVTGLLSGQTVLKHGVRSAWSPSEDIRLAADSLPAVLKRAGYTNVALADFQGGVFSRMENGFSSVRAPENDVKALLRREIILSHGHFLPYLGGGLGRAVFPDTRGLAGLADPSLLAAEARRSLRQLRRRSRFFLAVYFSALHEPYALSSSDARRALKGKYHGPVRYGLPRRLRKALSPEDEGRLRALYNANAAAIDKSLGRILDALHDLKLEQNTVVVLWSPHGEQFFEKGRGLDHGGHLRGTEIFSAPLVIRDRVRRQGAVVAEPVRTEDVAPTMMSLLNLPAPEAMEGISLTRREFGGPPDEFFAAYAETELRPEGQSGPDDVPMPPLSQALTVDWWGDFSPRLSMEAEDHALFTKHRFFQVGPERLVYVPARSGVRYELYDFSTDPQGLTDIAATPRGAQRVLELKDMFFRYLSLHEKGWRPQNGYWIPEAMLRQEEVP